MHKDGLKDFPMKTDKPSQLLVLSSFFSNRKFRCHLFHDEYKKLYQATAHVSLEGIHLSQAVVTTTLLSCLPGCQHLTPQQPGFPRLLQWGSTAGFIQLLAEGTGTGAVYSQGATTGRRNKDTDYRMLKSSFALKDEKGRH